MLLIFANAKGNFFPHGSWSWTRKKIISSLGRCKSQWGVRGIRRCDNCRTKCSHLPQERERKTRNENEESKSRAERRMVIVGIAIMGTSFPINVPSRRHSHIYFYFLLPWPSSRARNESTERIFAAQPSHHVCENWGIAPRPRSLDCSFSSFSHFLPWIFASEWREWRKWHRLEIDQSNS